MKLLLVRHAKAISHTKALLKRIKDEDRPLTKKGIEKFAVKALKLKSMFRNTGLWVSSPSIRAQQTLEVLLQTNGIKNLNKVLELDSVLNHANPKGLTTFLTQRKEKKIVVVSHEPFLTNFLNARLKSEWPHQKIKKGAVIVLNFEDNQFSFEEIV